MVQFEKKNQVLYGGGPHAFCVCQFFLQYRTIQRFCNTWQALNFSFTPIMKCNLEN